MNYFSRLTDIVTCNLAEMLAREPDPSPSRCEKSSPRWRKAWREPAVA